MRSASRSPRQNAPGRPTRWPSWSASCSPTRAPTSPAPTTPSTAPRRPEHPRSPLPGSEDMGKMTSMEIPAHVPAELVRDFDFVDMRGETDVYAHFSKLHDGPDIIYSPRHGGHWIATRFDDM